MDTILVPKQSDTGGSSGGGWAEINLPDNEFNISVKLIKSLSEKTKEIDLKLIKSEDKANAIDDRFEKMEKRQNFVMNFVVVVATAIIVGFFLAAIPIFLDYTKFNGEKYQGCLDKVSDVSESLYKGYQSEDNKIYEKVNNQNIDLLKLKSDLDLLRAKNSYLK